MVESNKRKEQMNKHVLAVPICSFAHTITLLTALHNETDDHFCARARDRVLVTNHTHHRAAATLLQTLPIVMVLPVAPSPYTLMLPPKPDKHAPPDTDTSRLATHSPPHTRAMPLAAYADTHVDPGAETKSDELLTFELPTVDMLAPTRNINLSPALEFAL